MKMQKLRIFGVAVAMIFSLLTIAGFQGGCNSPTKEATADSNTSNSSSEAVQGDVSEDAVCKNLAAKALAQWGRIDALVNSAGATLFVPMSQLDDVQAADFQKIFGPP